MNILVSGIPRSGSTRLYNIIRLILLQKNSWNDLYCCWHDHFDLQKQRKHNIIKLHYFDQKFCDWADFIFTTKRDLRDVAASSLEFNQHRGRVSDNEVLLTFLHAVMTMYELWKEYSDYEVIYEQIPKFGLRDIMNLTEILEIENVNYGHVMSGLEDIKNSSKSLATDYDWNTLMNSYHISERTHLPFSIRLGEERTNLVNEACGSWLVENGYQI